VEEGRRFGDGDELLHGGQSTEPVAAWRSGC
jgi:hypothetical protein